MGLVPFHGWLPDVCSKSPATISSVFSGLFTGSAFLAFTRIMNAVPPELQDFCGKFLAGFGMLSVFLAVCFMIFQSNFKRLISYSGILHLGVLCVAWGLGSFSAAAVLLIGHLLIQGMLLLLADNLLLAFGTESISGVSRMSKHIPKTTILWGAGLFALCGMPPSPVFASLYMLVRDAFLAGRYWTGSLLLILFFAVFSGISAIFFRMSSGNSILPPSSGQRRSCILAENLCFVPA